jgi:hypothetical protein
MSAAASSSSTAVVKASGSDCHIAAVLHTTVRSAPKHSPNTIINITCVAAVAAVRLSAAVAAAGTPADPGLMVLSLGQIFREKASNVDAGEEFTVTCSYLEVYNEVRMHKRVRAD